MTQGPGEPLRGDVIEGDVVRVYGWEWSEVRPTRGGLPWIGIFLVVFGGLLLLREFVPALEMAGSLLVLALGIAFLVSWVVNRGTPSLYAGAIISALAAPDLLYAAGLQEIDGLGTICLGVAFLAIALVRALTRGGFGWQAVLGLVLLGIGGSQAAFPQVGDLLWPVLVVAVGVALLVGSARGRQRA